MLALFRNAKTIEPQAISRTFLDSAARKIGRKFLGLSEMRCHGWQQSDRLTIAEGLETG